MFYTSIILRTDFHTSWMDVLCSFNFACTLHVGMGYVCVDAAYILLHFVEISFDRKLMWGIHHFGQTTPVGWHVTACDAYK